MKIRRDYPVQRLALALWAGWAVLLVATPTAMAQTAGLGTPISSRLQTPVSVAPVGRGIGGDAAPSLSGAAVDSRTETQPLSLLATVGTDYRISPNDLMEFNVFGVPDMKRDVRVNASGLVSLPLIGSVQVAGLTAQEAELSIATKYGEKYLQNPQVSLFIKEFTTQRITVEGAVLKPGIYPVTGRLTLLRALALAGGYAQYANLNAVVVYRSLGAQREQQVFDLDKVRAGEEPDPDILNDDVIVVQRSASRAALRDSLFRDILDTINPFSNR